MINNPISTIAAIKTSLLTLTVSADDVALVVNRSPAEIISIEVTPLLPASPLRLLLLPLPPASWPPVLAAGASNRGLIR